MLNKKIHLNVFKYNKTHYHDYVHEKPKADIIKIYEKIIGGTIKRTGNVAMVYCPFHNEKTPSMALYPKTNSYYCFGCSKGGDTINLIEGVLGYNFTEALEFLKENQ